MNRFSLDWVLLTYTVIWSTSQCMKKERPDMEEFAAMVANKEDNPTIGELAKEFPEKSYRELEIYRDADRQQEAQQIPMTESQKSQEDLEPITKGVCVTGALRKAREKIDPQERIKELEVALANALAVNESHQKLNGKLQERLTELEEENKKLHDHVEKQITGARESGM
jgi:hypothetical protein